MTRGAGREGRDRAADGDASGTLRAAQAALAAEHAAVYGYGVLGGRLEGGRRAEAAAAHAGHRARRDALVRTVGGLGGRPVAADAAYALPFAVRDPAGAMRLAAVLEDRVAGVYSDLVRAARGPLRQEAAGALREAAVRAVRWRGSGVAFPGLAEKAGAHPPETTAEAGAEGVTP
ncbi:ferritin-like domain-containing protein [Streptomyces griseus]|uniref:ferritin-like domain-containing protein n=1 Tax=Streptomyces griseus TaxID=1911 RepID=UPI0008404253|nr:ferritin-like domain-containing protein [Streptomyces griseus]